MNDETGSQPREFKEIALKYIDGLADQAKTFVTIASPFLEEVAVAVGCLRDASGAQSFDRREAPGEGPDLGAVSPRALAFQVNRHPLASLAVVGAVAAVGYYIVRERYAG